MTHRTKERPGNQRRMSKEIELTTCRMAKPGSGEGGGGAVRTQLPQSSGGEPAIQQHGAGFTLTAALRMQSCVASGLG